MKSIPAILVSVSLLAVGVTTFAADPGNMYLNANVGGSYVNNVDIGPTGDKAEAEFKIGLRLDVALGYHLSDVWALEFETGWIWNSVDKLGGESVPSEVDFNLYQVPVLVNAVYHFRTETKWKPYVGVGLGGVASVLSIEAPHQDQSDTGFGFGYQLKGGVGYAVSENMQIDLGYKLFGAIGEEWDFTGTTIKADPMFTHALLVSFTWLF